MQNTIDEINLSGNSVLKEELELWDILYKSSPEQRKRIFEVLSVKPSRDTLVLDAGCGNGFQSKLLSDKGYTVVGTDVSRFKLRNAKKRYSTIPFIVGDLLHSPFIPQTFHITFISYFLHHFQNVAPAIAEIKKIARGDGEILIIEPNGTNLVYRFTEKLKYISPRDVMQTRGLNSKNETIHQYNVYMDVIHSLGFKNTKVGFVNAVEQEVKFDFMVLKRFLRSYGILNGMVMITRFLFLKLALKISNKSLSCGEFIIHAKMGSCE